MEEKTIAEIVVYIHGVSNALQDTPHTSLYKDFHDKIKHETWPQNFCGVEWGTKLENGTSNPENQELLTTAQRKLGDPVTAVIDEAKNSSSRKDRNSSRKDRVKGSDHWISDEIRKLMFYGIGDIFYYVSAEGKKAVLNAVAGQIRTYITTQNIDGEDTLLSLTIISHSAGAVIAFDFLHYLFSTSSSTNSELESWEEDANSMNSLRDRAEDHTLSLRKLITFGSPIAFTVFRSNEILEIFAKGNQLEPSNYGLQSQLNSAEIQMEQPRWINFWERTDPISWPVGPLVKLSDPPEILDVYLDKSNNITKAHNDYWNSRKVHKTIAKYWSNNRN